MTHEFYMALALQLAKHAWPHTSPNPLVGCVIVSINEVVSTGFHKKFGEAHAEVNAINNLPNELSPANCELYVTLEPCSHHGKTPPCADLIITKGFKKVIIACKDPNPLVSGKGIKKLEAAGIEVIVGVLEKEARELNKRFFTFFEKKRPYFILKWAQTTDGFMSRIPIPEKRELNHISGKESQVVVHQLRTQNMGILVGKNTVLNDNPLLTTRLVKGKNPIRLFIDKNLEVPTHFNIYNQAAETIVFNGLKNIKQDNIQLVKLDFDRDVLHQICDKLYELKIQSVLVEGGSYLLNEFIKQGLCDEKLVFVNPNLIFEKGLKAPETNLESGFEWIGDDKLFRS